MRNWKWFLPALLVLALWAACRKTDRAAEEAPPENRTERFFHQHPPAGPLVTALQQKMQRENDQQPFIETIIARIGYPRWDKALVISAAQTSGRGQSADSAIVYIPFVRDTQNFVNAALLFKLSPTDTSYQYLADWQYAGYGFDSTGPGLHARDVFHLFARLDGAVFGRTEFRIVDGRIFGRPRSETSRVRVRPAAVTSRGNTLVYTTFCDTYDHCWAPDGNITCAECTTECPQYIYSTEECTSVWVDDGWTSSTGGGSTGNGGGYPPPVCGGTAARTDQDPACPTGWQPVGGGAPAPNANQSIIDSLQGYPCAQEVLSKISSINSTTENILATVFNDSTDVNIIFVADSTLASNTNGYTPGSEVSYVNGIFKARVHLPPYILKNASREFIAKTMYHEAIHAYIDYRWLQYVHHQIDSNTFKTQFPKIWKYKNQQNIGQHIQMAETYVTNIKDIVLAFNPAISDSVNRAISWGGLTKTPAWESLGSDTFQLNRLRAISRDSNVTKMSSLNLHKCK